MIKLFQNKLIITFTVVTAVSGISISALSLIDNTKTTTKNLQASNIKEDLTKDITVDSQKEEPNRNDENTNLESDVTKISDDSNNKEIRQETIGSEIKKSNNKTDNNTVNKQETIPSQEKVTSSNAKTSSQNSISTNPKGSIPSIYYDRTTSIYANDNITLLRVEYYVNNKLTYYSVVEQFEATTKSYIEKIYKCNRETNIDSLIRTDVYENSVLIKSY